MTDTVEAERREIQESLQIPENLNPEEAAQQLFPDDEQLRNEYLALEQQFRDAAERANAEISGPSAKALPVIVAAVLPYLGACVVGAITNTVWGQISQLVKGDELGKAKDLIVDPLIGCIGGIVPIIPPPIRRKVAGEAAGFVIWLVVQRGPKK